MPFNKKKNTGTPKRDYIPVLAADIFSTSGKIQHPQGRIYGFQRCGKDQDRADGGHVPLQLPSGPGSGEG